MQVETLRARRSGRQRVPTVPAFTGPPRLSQRHEHLGPDQADIPLEIPQRDRVQSQALPVQPPQMIHQHRDLLPVWANSHLADPGARLGMLDMQLLYAVNTTVTN